VVICSNATSNNTCKGREDIDKLLNVIILNQLNVVEGIDFYNLKTKHTRPISADLYFYKQVQFCSYCKFETYSFLRNNAVEITDSRVNLFEQEYEYSFFDSVQGPEWNGQQRHTTENITYNMKNFTS